MKNAPNAPNAPIATQVVRALERLRNARTIDLGSVAREMKKASVIANRSALHPAHQLYVVTQNQLTVLAELLGSLREMAKIAERVSRAQEEYVPSGPPMSPLTGSYFVAWAMFDAAVGAARETFATCALASAQVLQLSPEFVQVLKLMQASRMGIYVHAGFNDKLTVLKDLVTNETSTCIVPSGWRGKSGELWLARVLPPPTPGSVSVVLTTPYVIRDAKEAEWLAYFDRTLGPAKGDATKSGAALKYEIDWSEYIFEGYADFVAEAVFLEGIPDRPETLPQADDD